MQSDKPEFKYTWEEAVEILRNDPAQQDLIFCSYLTRDLIVNCERFASSDEFFEALRLLGQFAPGARRLLDMPGGNGIATYAFARANFDVTSVEPDPSPMMGRGAIEHVLGASGIKATIVDAYGEALPFAADAFDVVYVRQGLHHARDLPRMMTELSRVLRPSGVLLACREHVVDNYGEGLQAFLDSQVDHQLYGGENAFTLPDYRSAIDGGGLKIELELGPYDSPINAYPNTPEALRHKVLESGPGRILRKVLPDDMVAAIGAWHVKRRKLAGRLYSFLAVKR
ncbi:Methyltransf_11 domain-containing protein [Gammaproteobacteria bacterium]